MLEALGLDLKEIIFVIINFLILIGVLGKFIYKPFLGALEHRKKTIEESFDQAAAVSRRADAKMANYSNRIANIEDEGRQIIKEARQQADVQAQEIIEEARQQAGEIIAKAERSIVLEKEKARDDMRQEIASIGLLVAEQIVGKEVDRTGQEAIVDDVINEARSAQWQN